MLGVRSSWNGQFIWLFFIAVMPYWARTCVIESCFLISDISIEKSLKIFIRQYLAQNYKIDFKQQNIYGFKLPLFVHIFVKTVEIKVLYTINDSDYGNIWQ